MLPPDEGWPRAIKAAEKALELDDTLAQAHSNVGAYRMAFYRDWAEAERRINYAIQLNPSAEETHYLYSSFLLTRGRFEEAITEGKLALELDPLSLRLHQHLGRTFYYARDYDKAISRYRQTLQLESDNAPLHEALGDALEQNGLHDEAIGEWEKAMLLSGDEELAGLLRQHHDHSGFASATRAVAQKRLERLQQRRQQGEYVPTIEFARAYLRMNDERKIFTVLNQAAAEPNVFALLLACDLFYDPIRTDSRFTEILARHGLAWDN